MLESGAGNITVNTWWHWYNNNGLAIENQCYLAPYDLFKIALARVNASCFGQWTLTQSHDPGGCVPHDGIHRSLQPRWACAGERVFTLSGSVDEPNGLSDAFFVKQCQLVMRPQPSQSADNFYVVLATVLVLAAVIAGTAALCRNGRCDGVIERWRVGHWLDRLPALSQRNDYELTLTESVYPPAEEQPESNTVLYGTI